MLVKKTPFFFLFQFFFQKTYKMQLFERLITHNKNKQQRQEDDDTITSSTSTVNNNNNKSKKKTFSFRKLCRKIHKTNKKKEVVCLSTEENQVLLTQCIETALFIPPVNKRWSLEEKRSIGFVENTPETTTTRQRKLSLPPQYSSIGYLASIPEVDSFTE
jgi:hypothetical protein